MTDSTHIFVVLDRSGSMHICRNDTIGGFNTFLEDQQKLGVDQAFLSLYQFDDKYETVYENTAIGEVQPLTRETFVPRGGTALLDAIGQTIKRIDVLKPTGKVIVVILTDGQENESKTYTFAHIADLIAERKARGYDFIFLGADQDAISAAAQLNIEAEAAMSFSSSKVEAMCTVLSSAVTKTRIDKRTMTSFVPEDRLKTT